MKNILVIGLGEIGTSVKNIEEQAGNKVYVCDLNVDKCKLNESNEYDIIHVCIPYKEHGFVKTVVEYWRKYFSPMVIIHSTVTVGTTRLIENYGVPVVHSFVRGIHPNLEEGLLTFEKPVGSSDKEFSSKASDHLESLGMKTKILSSSEASELSKVLSTTYYGYNIIFAKLVNEMCKQEGVDFDEVYTWANETYNQGYKELGKENVIRPVLFPPKGGIGGHCVVPNFNLLPPNDLAEWCISQNSK